MSTRIGRRLAGVVAALLLTTSGPAIGPAAAATPTLRVTNDQLVFLAGSVPIDVATSAPSITWTVTTLYGGTVLTGTQAGTGTTANFVVSSLPVGYYGLQIRTNTTEVGTASGSFAVLSAVPAARRGSDLGVAGHIVDGSLPAQMTAFDRVGFGSFRTQVPWSVIEKTKNTYTFPASYDESVAAIKAAGARPVLLVGKENNLYAGSTPENPRTPSTAADLAAFGRYAKAVVDHYGPDVDLEIWNEFMYHNTSSCGTTPQCYQPMLDAVRAAVAPTYPGVELTAAAVQSGTTNTVDLTSLDAAITHQYVYPDRPETAMRSRMESFRDLIRSRPGGELHLWMTEYGWPTPHPEGQSSTDTVSEDVQADYLVRGAVFGLASGLDKLWTYEIVDSGYDLRDQGVPQYDIEHHFGLMRLPVTGFAGITPKPSLVSQAVLVRQIGNLAYVGRSDTDPTTYAYRFGEGATSTRVLWTSTSASDQVDVHTTGAVTVTDRFGATSTRTPVGGAVRIALSGHPQYVTGAITAVTQA